MIRSQHKQQFLYMWVWGGGSRKTVEGCLHWAVHEFAVHEHPCFAFEVSKYPSSGVNLTSEPCSTPIITIFNKLTSFSEAFHFRQSHTCLQINFRTEKPVYWQFTFLPPTTVGGAAISWAGGGGGLSVSEVKINTSKLGPSLNSVLLRWAPS